MARRTAEEAAETRDAILRAARRLFTEKGFADATLDEVAARVGVTKGALYHHFRDKRRLFLAVFEELEKELDAAARAGAVEAAGGPRAAFRAGCRAYLDFALRPDFQRIALTDGPGVLGAEGVALDARLGLPTVEAAVKGLTAVGLLEPRPSKPLALFLLGALNAAGLALARGEPGFTPEAALETLDRVLDGLAPSPKEQPQPKAPERAERPARPAKPGRLDERLVRDGHAETRTKAQALIRTGRVLVDDVPVEKPGAKVREEAAVRLRGEERRFASRGGEKLAGALADLGVDPAGRVCLDVGASTGGFTDCLLQAGARRVVALDVGYGQLHPRLRADPRVAVLERSHARTVAAARVHEAAGAPIELVVMDVSFISSALLLPRLAELAPGAEWLVLVKPQFEVGRGQVGKGGVVRDERLRAGAVARVREAARALGYAAAGEAESRLAGPKGNREVFLQLRPKPDRTGTD
jgi:23S rRNA (cytidine1920-2'-O)/16S rRNA (cytidine1409-2'-O)-methyltransferase